MSAGAQNRNSPKCPQPTPMTTMEMGSVSTIWRPQAVTGFELDLRHYTTPTAAMIAKIDRLRPITARTEAFGNEGGYTVTYFATGDDSISGTVPVGPGA